MRRPLVDEHGNEFAIDLDVPPPSCDEYMGQRSDETCEQYEDRRDRERRRDLVIAGWCALFFLAGAIFFVARHHG